MRFLLVLSQAFPVVGSDNDEAAFEKIVPAQGIPEDPHLLIDVAELGVVSRAEARSIARGKIVGRVQIIEMEEEKEGAAGICVQPLAPGCDHVCTQPLNVSRVGLLFAM